jgi:hypothetical protein
MESINLSISELDSMTTTELSTFYIFNSDGHDLTKNSLKTIMDEFEEFGEYISPSHTLYTYCASFLANQTTYIIVRDNTLFEVNFVD